MRQRSFDVVVVGAGPAGLAAAARAAEAGRRVAVVDDNPAPGGQIWRAERGRLAAPARPWIDRLLAAGVEILSDTSVVHADGPAVAYAESSAEPLYAVSSGEPLYAVSSGEPLYAVSSGELLYAVSSGEPLALYAERWVLATGAHERFLPFPGWTLPGVYGVGGLQALVKGGWDVRGQRVVLAGSGPLLLAVGAALRRRGAKIMCVAEQAPLRRLARLSAGLLGRGAKLMQLARLELALAGVARRFSTWPVRALGDGRVEAVVLRSSDGRERTVPSGGSRGGDTVPCDALACGFNLVPDTRLAALLGCACDGGRVVVDRFQATSVDGVFCAGESTGVGGVDLATVEGEIAGLAAAGEHGRATALLARRRREQRFAAALERAFALRQELRGLADDDTVVCRCEDATWGEVRRAADARDAKLHSRCGMGPCQGRVCGPALEFLRGFPQGPPRPPLFPVSLRLWAELPAAPRSEFPERKKA